MNEAFAARIAALGNPTDDSSWLDVRRRARRGRARTAILLAPLAAAVAVAGALAANGGWVFSAHDRQITAKTDVSVGAREWHVSYTADTRRHGELCARASAAGAAIRLACAEMGPGSPRLGPPFGALELNVAGGQIWVGATVGFAQRITITDAAGRVHAARAIAAPKGTKTPFRYWAIGIAGSTGRSIAAYDAHGRKLTAKLP